MESRYPALRFIAKVNKLVGWAALVIGVGYGVANWFYWAKKCRDSSWGFCHENPFIAWERLLAGCAYGVIGLIALRAAAESIFVLLDIEENTRAASSRDGQT